jgi:hypothetical protein
MQRRPSFWRLGASSVPLFLAALAFGVVLAEPASAERWRRQIDQTYPHITAQSDWYPSETATGAVRRTPRGDEVRLPGGTWVPCGFNCYHTLKNATVDFWRRYDVFPQ